MTSKPDITALTDSGAITSGVLALLAEHTAVGVRTKELDKLAEEYIRAQGGVPAFLGYRGFPASVCTSVNGEVVHGIPSDYKLADGDLVSMDVGVKVRGWYTDAAITVAVGTVPEQTLRLLAVTYQALQTGIEQARPGRRTGDMGAAIQQEVEAAGFNVIRDCVGHGIGKSLHEQPSLPNYGTRGQGTKFKAGMALAIEPMVVTGSPTLQLAADHWTLTTEDSGLAAHFEESVLVTEAEAVRLTPMPEGLLGVNQAAKLGKVS